MYPAGSKTQNKLRELYDHVSELPHSDFIFKWYRINADNVCIDCIGDEVRIYKVDYKEDSPEQVTSRLPDGDVLGELIDQAFDSTNWE